MARRIEAVRRADGRCQPDPACQSDRMTNEGDAMDASATATPAADLDLAPSGEEPIPASPSATGSPGNRPARERGLGRLTDAAPDTMTLHTQEAYRLFPGRKADTAGQGRHRRCAPLRRGAEVHLVSVRQRQPLRGLDPDPDVCGTDHPPRSARRRSPMRGRKRSRPAKRKGLSFSVMASRAPLERRTRFRSPYGYATAEAIVEFDYTCG